MRERLAEVRLLSARLFTNARPHPLLNPVRSGALGLGSQFNYRSLLNLLFVKKQNCLAHAASSRIGSQHSAGRCGSSQDSLVDKGRQLARHALGCEH